MDVTAKLSRINGSNSYTNYIKTDSFIIDGSQIAGLMATGTHDLVKYPKGQAVTGVRIVILDTATSEGDAATSEGDAGTATLQFLVQVGAGTAVAMNATEIDLENMVKGMVHNFPASAIATYGDTDEITFQMTVGAKAYTALKFIIFIDYISIEDFLTSE